MFNRSKDMVRSLKEIRNGLMQLAFDYKQLGSVDKVHLSKNLTSTEVKLLALLTMIGDMLNEDQTAPALGTIRITNEKVYKKTWLWGLITKEYSVTTGPPITMTVEDFIHKRQKGESVW